MAWLACSVNDIVEVIGDGVDGWIILVEAGRVKKKVEMKLQMGV